MALFRPIPVYPPHQPQRKPPPRYPDYTAVDIYAASNSGYQAAASSWSGTVVWGGNNKMLAVDVEIQGVGVTVSSITYGGAACTVIASIQTVTAFGRVESWVIKQSDSGAPSADANTLAVTLSAGTAAFAVTSAAYTGVHQTTAIEGANTAQGSNAGVGNDATVNATATATGCWVHGAISTDDTAVTAGQTSRNNVTGATGSGANQDSGGTVSPGAVASSYSGLGITATWGMSAFSIRPTTASNSFDRTLADAPSTADSVARTVSAARTLADTPSTADAVVRTVSSARTLSDIPSTADAVTRVVSAARTMAGAPSTADGVVRLVGAARGVHAPPAYQSSEVGSGGSTTPKTQLVGTVAVGDLIVVVVVQNGQSAGVTYTVTDDLGNTYASAAEANGNGNRSTEIFYTVATVGGECTVSAASDGSVGWSLGTLLARAATTISLDAASTFADTSTTNHFCAASGAIDTVPNAIVVAACTMASGGGGTIGDPANFTRAEQFATTLSLIWYRESAAALTDERANWTTTSSIASINAVVSFTAGGDANSPSTSDALTRTGAFGRTLDDAPSTADEIARTGEFARTLADAPSTADEVSQTVTIQRTADDTPSTADAVTTSLVAARTLADGPSTADAVTRTGAFTRTLDDAPSTADATTAEVTGAGNLNRTLADSPSTADAVTRTGTFSRTLADGPSTADATARAVATTKTLADTPATADGCARVYVAFRTFTDLPVISDSISRSAATSRTLADAPSTADVTFVVTQEYIPKIMMIF